jgi:predicted hotdog family 3-hydroxylacyl-ACP dehydratase
MNPAASFPAMAELLPHEAPMILLDNVEQADETHIECSVLLSERDPFMVQGRVRGVVCLEYMAQAVGAFVGLERRGRGLRPQIGYIVGLRSLKLHQAYLDRGDRLTVRASLTWSDLETATFEAAVACNGRAVAEGQITVYQPNDPGAVS